MGYIRQAINVYNDDTAVGSDVLPVNSVIYINSNKTFYIKDNNNVLADIVTVVPSCTSSYKFNNNYLDDQNTNNLSLYAGVEPSYIIGKFDNCLVLNNNTGLGTDLNKYLIKNNTFSISFWVRSDSSTQSQYAGILCQGADSGFGLLLLAMNNQIALANQTSNITVTNTWQHVVICSDSTGVKYYSNDVLITTAGVIGSITDSNNNIGKTTVGVYRNNAVGNFFFTGNLEKLRVFDKVLTLDEINSLYTETFSPNVLISLFNGDSIPQVHNIQNLIINNNIILLSTRTCNVNTFTKAVFYGGRATTVSNTCTILSSTATLVQNENNIGTARLGLAGANIGIINSLFYGRDITRAVCTLLSPTATLIQNESNIGTSRSYLCGANVGVNALFYNGDNFTSTTTLLSPIAILVQPETSVGMPGFAQGGTNVGINGIFHGGGGYGVTNRTEILSPIATLVLAEVYVGTARYCLAGANVGINALFYGGNNGNNLNTCTLLSSAVTLVQAESNIGVARELLAGANVGINALFCGGSTVPNNITTLLSPTATLVQAESNVGTARSLLAGASL